MKLSFWFTNRDKYQTLKEGSPFPQGYGLVMADPSTRSDLIAIIPLNWVLGFGWWLYYKFQNKEWNKELWHAYDLGLRDGNADRQRAKLHSELGTLIKGQSSHGQGDS